MLTSARPLQRIERFKGSFALGLKHYSRLIKWNSFCLREVLAWSGLIQSDETARRENPVIFLFVTLLKTCDRGRKKRRIHWPETEFRCQDSYMNMSPKRALFLSVQCEVFLGSYMRSIFKGRRRFYRGHRRPYISENRHLDEPGAPLDDRKTLWFKPFFAVIFVSNLVNLDLCTHYKFKRKN